MKRPDARAAEGIALLFVMTLIAYMPAMRAGFIWDDDEYVSQNEALTSPAGLRQIWSHATAAQYYPMVHTSFWLEYRLWGVNPRGYHLVNILLHATGASILWLVLSRLRIPGAWLAAAIFALHPVQVDSVAWVTERKNTLASVFCLLAALAYIRFERLDTTDSTKDRCWGAYGLAFALFLLAMLSKTAMLGLPLALLVVLWWKRDRIRARDVLPVLPMLLAGIGLALLTVYFEKHESGATGEEFRLGLVERGLIAGRAFWFYLGKLAWPVPVIPVYPRWSINTLQWWQYLYPLAALGLLITLWRLRSRIGKGPLTALLVFGIMIGPALGLVSFYWMRFSFVADHFQYFASIGAIALAACFVHAGLSRAARGRSAVETMRGDRLIVAGYLVVLFTLGILTWRQTRIYRDLETVSRETIARNPSAHLALVNLAMIHANRGELDKAKPFAQRALQAYPALPEARHLLGLSLLAEGRLDDAATEFRRALELDPSAPEPQLGLGRIHAARGELNEAIECFRKSVTPWDRYAPGHLALGTALARQGDTEQAIVHLQKALTLKPGDPEAHEALGMILARKGRSQEAMQHAIAALQAGPSRPRALYILGLALAQEGQLEKSTAALKQALAAAPQETEIKTRLAMNLLQAGKLDDGIQVLTEAVRDRPDDAEARCNLAMALVRKGDAEGAIQQLRDFTKTVPQAATAHKLLGEILLRQNRAPEAIAEYQAALAARPGWPAAANDLAWVLATHPDAHLRNGAEAVRLAEGAATETGFKEWSILDTLAAAYAEAGRMSDAVSAAQTALTLAAVDGRNVQALEARLKLYQSGKPYRASP